MQSPKKKPASVAVMRKSNVLQFPGTGNPHPPQPPQSSRVARNSVLEEVEQDALNAFVGNALSFAKRDSIRATYSISAGRFDEILRAEIIDLRADVRTLTNQRDEARRRVDAVLVQAYRRAA
jgi:hypothetical protein